MSKLWFSLLLQLCMFDSLSRILKCLLISILCRVYQVFSFYFLHSNFQKYKDCPNIGWIRTHKMPKKFQNCWLSKKCPKSYKILGVAGGQTCLEETQIKATFFLGSSLTCIIIIIIIIITDILNDFFFTQSSFLAGNVYSKKWKYRGITGKLWAKFINYHPWSIIPHLSLFVHAYFHRLLSSVHMGWTRQDGKRPILWDFYPLCIGFSWPSISF